MIHVLDHQCKVDGGKLTAVKTHVLPNHLKILDHQCKVDRGKLSVPKFKWGLVTNFLISLRNETHHLKDHIKIGHCVKFEVV